MCGEKHDELDQQHLSSKTQLQTDPLLFHFFYKDSFYVEIILLQKKNKIKIMFFLSVWGKLGYFY